MGWLDRFVLGLLLVAGVAVVIWRMERIQNCPRGTEACSWEWYAASARLNTGRAIVDESRARGVDPALALAVWKAETECHEHTGCVRGSCGPMQVQCGVWLKRLGLKSCDELLGERGARHGVHVLSIFADRYDPEDGSTDWVWHYKCGREAGAQDCKDYAAMVAAHVPGFAELPVEDGGRDAR